MTNFKTFVEFKGLITEGVYDKIISMYTKITDMFKDPAKLLKVVNSVATESASKNFLPKTVKVGETNMVVMGDPKNPAGDFSIAFTKLADLPDGSGLFQITGTTSKIMLKALVGTEMNEDLMKNSLIAIVPPAGFVKDKPATMRILKNIVPGGKDYVSQSLVQGVADLSGVEKILTKI